MDGSARGPRQLTDSGSMPPCPFRRTVVKPARRGAGGACAWHQGWYIHNAQHVEQLHSNRPVL